jgi:hypothetical protein
VELDGRGVTAGGLQSNVLVTGMVAVLPETPGSFLLGSREETKTRVEKR